MATWKDHMPRVALERELAYHMQSNTARGVPSKALHTKARKFLQWMAYTGYEVNQGGKPVVQAGEKFPQYPVAWEND
jgi:hypothetical protein